MRHSHLGCPTTNIGMDYTFTLSVCPTLNVLLRIAGCPTLNAPLSIAGCPTLNALLSIAGCPTWNVLLHISVPCAVEIQYGTWLRIKTLLQSIHTDAASKRVSSMVRHFMFSDK